MRWYSYFILAIFDLLIRNPTKVSTIYLIESKYKKRLIVNSFHKFSTKNMRIISYSNASCIIYYCDEHKIARQIIDTENKKIFDVFLVVMDNIWSISYDVNKR
ncbi:hypothetical protein AYY23_09610 [Photobacterium kishitanii]|nr:hypothetical protein AYY23_09610 [Photobacterium kishitanii]